MEIKLEQWKMKMDENMNGKMIDDMVEMGDEWKIWWWKMMEHEMDMVDDIWCGEIEATNLASCLLTTIIYVYHIIILYHSEG